MAKSTSSFSELAQMYFPGCATPKNAVRCLQRSIKRCTKLATLLAETGYLPYNHRCFRPSSKCLYSRIWVTHTLIKFLKRHKNGISHSDLPFFLYLYFYNLINRFKTPINKLRNNLLINFQKL
mgnify:CR=1 FL=1